MAPLMLNRMVNITEIDGHKHSMFDVTFIENRRIKHNVTLTMSSKLMSMIQHWLEHQDDLFQNKMENKR